MNSDMRAFAVFLCVCLLAGCASKPEYYISPAPVTIPKTATYWLDTFDVEVEGQNDRFMSDDKVREQLGIDLINRLLKAKRYATSKASADYLLDVKVVYKRLIQDTHGALVSTIIEDNKYLVSVDFSYEVKVKKGDTEVLHFAQTRERLMPSMGPGQWQHWKTVGGILTRSGNSNVEGFYTGNLSSFIATDLRNIPSR
jgi:hypothetical protein